MSAKVVKEGYLTKRAIVSGRNWKKRYFILRQDGRFSYSETQGQPEKNHIDLTASSTAEVFEELATEGGIYVSGPTHDELFLKAPSTKGAKMWIKKINEVAQRIEAQENARRQADLKAYASTNKSKFLSPRKSLSKLGSTPRRGGGGGEGSTTDKSTDGDKDKKGSGKSSGSSTPASSSPSNQLPSKEQYWRMKVGEEDRVVDPRTMMYYKDEVTFLQGGDYLGKATLDSLV